MVEGSAHTEHRLTEIEIALAHAEATIDELSGLAREQADAIARLERMVARMAERLETLEAGTAPEADAPPPHW